MRKELSAVIKEFPKATVVGVADGARDNWEFLNEVTDRQVIDFFHVAEYLNEAADIILYARVTLRKRHGFPVAAMI
jgi:hypothetical protein